MTPPNGKSHGEEKIKLAVIVNSQGQIELNFVDRLGVCVYAYRFSTIMHAQKCAHLLLSMSLAIFDKLAKQEGSKIVTPGAE